MTQRVSIQGYEGSFHQQAARQFFGADVAILPCANFRDVVRLAADAAQCDAGVMAIENSIAGSILPNYPLLSESGLRIVGEVVLHIRQNLLVNRGVSLSEIREVHSHPMALLQCMDYLEQQKDWRLVETVDTALSARQVKESGSRHIAAIAGTLAADLFDLDMVAPDIHTMPHNYTRFLILKRAQEASVVTDADKASFYFQIDNHQGSLAQCLGILAAGGLNLSKLQSVPIPRGTGEAWQYGFHADVEFPDPAGFEEVMSAFREVVNHLQIYGIYKRSRD